MSRGARSCAFAAALLAGATMPARAQGTLPTPVIPELRADVLFGRRASAQLGGGIQIPFGYYARLGIDAAVGMRLVNDLPGSRVDGRLDLLTRFLLDPFRQSPYGLSLGGGIGLRAEPQDHVRPVLLAALDVEGRRWSNGWVPAVQVGLGDGARVGIVLRRASLRAR